MALMTGYMLRNFFRRGALGAAILWLSLPAALAQSTAGTAGAAADYPSKPIRIVVTFPPGGSADAVIRLLVPRLVEKLGQQVLVDNRPGAGGNIGLAVVAKAPADGYTLGVGAAGALAANASLYAQMPFDVARDFKPVTMLAAIPFVIAGHPTVGASTQGALVALARTQPGRLSIAHGGNGTAMHLTSQLFQQMAGVQFTEVPYKGSGPAALDVLAGQVPLGVLDLPASLQHIRAGKLLAFAVTSPRRLPQLPEVPTVAEAGLQGYDSTGWFGVVAPAGTPDAIVQRLNAAFVAALDDAGNAAAMRAQGVEPAPSSAASFGAYIQSETLKWAGVVRKANIKID
jgi:tripartite-type tricarboxylate transporter receptor subunit TctC